MDIHASIHHKFLSSYAICLDLLEIRADVDGDEEGGVEVDGGGEGGLPEEGDAVHGDVLLGQVRSEEANLAPGGPVGLWGTKIVIFGVNYL